jgi:hypothetical protein
MAVSRVDEADLFQRAESALDVRVPRFDLARLDG